MGRLLARMGRHIRNYLKICFSLRLLVSKTRHIGRRVRYREDIFLLSTCLSLLTTHVLHFSTSLHFLENLDYFFPFLEKPLHFYFKISIKSLHFLFPNITGFSSAFFFFVCLKLNSHRSD